MTADVRKAGAVLREFSGIVIAAVADNTCARHEFLAAAVQINRRKKLPTRSENEKSNERLVVVYAWTDGIVHCDTRDQIVASNSVPNGVIDIRLSWIEEIRGANVVAYDRGRLIRSIGNRLMDACKVQVDLIDVTCLESRNTARGVGADFDRLLPVLKSDCAIQFPVGTTPFTAPTAK